MAKSKISERPGPNVAMRVTAQRMYHAGSNMDTSGDEIPPLRQAVQTEHRKAPRGADTKHSTKKPTETR